MSCGIGHRQGLNLVLLWLWCRPEAISPLRPLAWEPLYALGAAPRHHHHPKKKEKKEIRTHLPFGNKTDLYDVPGQTLDRAGMMEITWPQTKV